MDKLKKRKILVFLLGISCIAFLFGSFFITIINDSDKELVKEYIGNFINDCYSNHINYSQVLKETLFSNIFYIVMIWLLGLSVIGIPIILFTYFFKTFTLGFSISSFILTYQTKGLVYSVFYLVPNEIVKFIIYTLLMVNAIKISKRITKAVIAKESIHFGKFMNRYLKILAISFAIIVLCSLYEVYIIPFIYNKLYFLIK